MTINWQQENIILRYEDKIAQVSAKVSGSLAVHDSEYEFTITHVPTGLKLIGMPHEKIALELAEKLSALDWGNVPNQLPHMVTLEASKPIIFEYMRKYSLFEYEQCLLED